MVLSTGKLQKQSNWQKTTHFVPIITSKGGHSYLKSPTGGSLGYQEFVSPVLKSLGSDKSLN